MNQNLSCFNFHWHVFPCNSGMFRGTMLITIFYSSNICMLLQQPVKLHKWEEKKGGRWRRMIASPDARYLSARWRVGDCLDPHHNQATASCSSILMRIKHKIIMKPREIVLQRWGWLLSYNHMALSLYSSDSTADLWYLSIYSYVMFKAQIYLLKKKNTLTLFTRTLSLCSVFWDVFSQYKESSDVLSVSLI